MGCDNCKDLGEDPWGHGNAEGEDSELIVIVTHVEAEEFEVVWMDIDMEVSIFHVQSCKPRPLGREGMIDASVTIWNLVFLMKMLSKWRLRIGRRPLTFFGMRKRGE